MKQYILTIATLIAVIFTAQSQSLNYQDLAVLFSSDDQNGTARFTAMSGAFGAIGGDVSAINVNPAGLAVYKNSGFSGTFNTRSTEINADYYGNSILTKNEFFNFSQAGGVLVFDTSYESEWTKFVLGFNYRITKDFKNNFTASGNSGFASFDSFPLDVNTPTLLYDIADNQEFNNSFTGEMSEFNFGISAVHQNKLYIGASINTYDLKFLQTAELIENNNDGNGNTLNANLYQENLTTGTGYSLNTGFIYKAHQNFRFGISYQTPTWFTEIFEETNILENKGFFGDTEIEVSNDNIIFDNTTGNNFPIQEVLYKLKTPGKLTGSAAFVFGKKGLISIDYTRKNYQKINLSNENFTTENQFFQNSLRNTYSFNVGTEWRMDRFSIRGGYKFEQNPYANAVEENDLKGYSFGGGYHFGDIKIDLSYSNSTKNGSYNFYSQYNQVNAADLNFDNSKFTATITFNL